MRIKRGDHLILFGKYEVKVLSLGPIMVNIIHLTRYDSHQSDWFRTWAFDILVETGKVSLIEDDSKKFGRWLCVL